MTKAIAYRKEQNRSEKKRAHFNGAVKSENEFYFQIASLFREATRGHRQLSMQMVEKMLKAKADDHPVKKSVYTPY